MPEHTLHLEPAQLQHLVGADAAAALMRLPAQYRAQAAAAAAAAGAGAAGAPGAGTAVPRGAADVGGGGEGAAVAAELAETGGAPALQGDAAAAAPPRLVECFIRRFSAATRPWIKMHADVAGVTVNVLCLTRTLKR